MARLREPKAARVANEFPRELLHSTPFRERFGHLAPDDLATGVQREAFLWRLRMVAKIAWNDPGELDHLRNADWRELIVQVLETLR